MNIIDAVLTGLHSVCVTLQNAVVVDWSGYTLSLFDVLLSFMIFEKILSCIFAGFTRLGENYD